MSQAFYRKWRPTTWEEVVGQDHIIKTLHNAVMSGRVGHAYLFAGPRGTGKTTSARLLAKAVNCLEEDLAKRPCNQCPNCEAVNQGRYLDLIEIDAASNTSVDDVRDLRDKINFSPSQGKFKVYIIDEVHMLSTSAFNALLKTLEEPPAHVIFILATTEIHKIPATVLSRCQRHEFRRIPVQIIVAKLRQLCDEEKINIQDDTLTLIARQSTGSLRDAISLVDQLASMTQTISLEIARDVLGTTTSQTVIDLISAVLDHDDSGGLSKIHQALDAGSDPRQFSRQVIEYLRSLLLIKMGLKDQVEAPDEMKSSMQDHADRFDITALLQAINDFSSAATDLKANWHPGLGLEIAFAKIVTARNGAQTPPVMHPSAQDKPVQASTPAKSETQQNTSSSPPSTAKPRKAKQQTVEVHTNSPKQQSSPSVSSDPEPDAQGLSLKRIKQQWKAVRDLIRQENPRTEALLNSSKLLGLKDDALVLSFTSELLREKMAKESNIALACKILKQIFNQDLKIHCIVANRNKTNLPSDVEVDSDGMVGTATRDLGGEIVDVQ